MIVAKDTIVTDQAQQICVLNEIIVAKDTIVTDQAQQISVLNEIIVAKDTIVAGQAQEISVLNEIIVAKDTIVTDQAQQISVLNEIIGAKDTVFADHAEEIRHLNGVITYLNEVVEAKESQILREHLSKWYRLGSALKTRPITLHSFARIVYLSTGLIVPKSLRTTVSPIISNLRQQYFNAQQVSLDKTIKRTTKSQATLRQRVADVMPKQYKLLYILWYLKDQEHRTRFLIVLQEHIETVTEQSPVESIDAITEQSPIESIDAITDQPQFLSTPSDMLYNDKVLCLGNNAKILLVVHEFSRTGAPYAVLYLARALFSLYGVRPAVISPHDGPIREELEQEGFPTVVDPLLFGCQQYSSAACNFVASFERVIVTSLGSFSFIHYFKNSAKHLTWWIHETDVGFNAVASMTPDLPLLFDACESIWLGSPLCFPLALQYASQDKLHLLLYGCNDTALPDRPHKSGKIVFSIAGSIEPRKGQDIFLAAIKRLPNELRDKAIFRIIGSPLPYHESAIFYKKVHSKALRIPEVECIENMPSDKLLEFYAETDVLVSASRDDPMPIVITQGLMFSKLCLCSSVIGHAQLLEDQKDGLIFTNESVEDLSEKMAWILQNPSELTAIGMAGRELYEKYFLMGSFVNNVGNLI
jgi:glycosyltransferase involved in cell wall biosynthesis